jgi:hypothetical protein
MNNNDNSQKPNEKMLDKMMINSSNSAQDSNSAMNASSEEFNLFAPPAHDDLEKEIAKGKHQWTNKTTKVLIGAFAVVGLLSVGGWWGHRTAVNAENAATASRASAFASAFGLTGGSGFGRSGRSSFGGGTSSFGGASGSFSFGSGNSSGGFGGGSFAGGSFGSGGKISSISNGKITITLNNPTSSTLKVGDRVSVVSRSSLGGAGGFGGASQGAPGGFNASDGAQVGAAGAPGASTGATSSRQGTYGSRSQSGQAAAGAVGGASSGKTNTTSHSGSAGQTPGKSGSGTAVGQSGSAQAGAGQSGSGQRGGGLFSNPAFTQCLSDNGVTLTPGTRPDRNDPKVAAALQTCFQKLGGAGFGGGSRSGAGAGTSTGSSTGASSSGN